MKLLTANLTGKALDWALAVALEKTPALSFKREVVVSSIMGWLRFDHTDPALCLGLIKEHKLTVLYAKFSLGYFWRAHTQGEQKAFIGFGATLEQAVARCVVAMRLGDEVDVPDELCGEQA